MDSHSRPATYDFITRQDGAALAAAGHQIGVVSNNRTAPALDLRYDIRGVLEIRCDGPADRPSGAHRSRQFHAASGARRERCFSQGRHRRSVCRVSGRGDRFGQFAASGERVWTKRVALDFADLTGFARCQRHQQWAAGSGAKTRFAAIPISCLAIPARSGDYLRRSR